MSKLDHPTPFTCMACKAPIIGDRGAVHYDRRSSPPIIAHDYPLSCRDGRTIHATLQNLRAAPFALLANILSTDSPTGQPFSIKSLMPLLVALAAHERSVQS